MADMRVWAPNAHDVTVHSSDQKLAMTKAAGGWWHVDAPFIRHGVDYAFAVDGNGPFPDPRSFWQPNGIHGFSRWVDHSLFQWTDAAWQQPPLGSAVIYELHLGTFTPEGTCEAAINRLDHLKTLGITHVELMPVAQFSGERGWGYDGVDLYAPHQAYGGPEGVKRLVDACHHRGLAVLLDVVYNHLGPAGNYLSQFGPYFTDRYATPWGEAINFDEQDSHEVRQFFIDNAVMWLRDYHFDGLRIDAVHAILDTSAIHFLEALASVVKNLETALGRHLVLIAESDLNDPRVIRSPAVGGYGIHAQWNEDFHHALHAVLTGETQGYYQDFGSLAHLAKVLTRGVVYDGCYSTYRRRCHGRPATGILGTRFVGCLQNHDQVGNRALGERTSRLLSPGLLKIGAALIMTSAFVPMLFQGEEWGATTPFLYFTDHREPGLGEAVKHGRRKEFAAFGWESEVIPDPQAEETFVQSRLHWDELQEENSRRMLAWHQSLIALRRRLSPLTDGEIGRVSVLFDETDRWLTMARGPVLVACNFAETPRTISCAAAKDKKMVLSSADGFVVEDTTLMLPAQAVAILVG
ncbi:MAG TPA: malto-oligosyltrehalose trehalohydrolase [Desulfotignum sp.]|nr:malto-oligosyltrehalose trehalohydrolase [Desulfotignum sp.]